MQMGFEAHLTKRLYTVGALGLSAVTSATSKAHPFQPRQQDPCTVTLTYGVLLSIFVLANVQWLMTSTEHAHLEHCQM